MAIEQDPGQEGGCRTNEVNTVLVHRFILSKKVAFCHPLLYQTQHHKILSVKIRR